MKLPGFAYDARRRVATFYCFVPGTDGRKRRKRTLTDVPSRAEAIRLWTAFRDELEREALEPAVFAKRPMLKTFVEERFDEMTSRLRPASREFYGAFLRRHLLPKFGEVPMDQLTSQKINAFIGEMLRDGFCPKRGKERRPHGCTPACVKKPYSGTTINDAVHVLRVVIGWAVELDVLDGSPVKKKVKWARQSLPELELTLDERRRFLAAFEDEALFRAYLERIRTPPKIVPHPSGGMKRVGGGRRPDGKAAKEIFRRLQHYRPFFWTLLDTGLRLSDALNLRWASVSLEENVLRVVTQKKDKPVTLPLSNVVRTALETLKKRPVISEFVFLDEDGKPLTKEKVSRKFAMAKAVAGITRRFRIHDLRHTFASTLVSSGVNLKVVSDLLGHTDLATTARYARGDHRALADVANVLNRVNDTTSGK
ncbi:MAG TPA: tyrosine-type recombinase/integrase [Thermoanaerobaculia bacterium]|nr:tyrosine-type recombinase/integrase [Thermoanaerobaculia bacterium]